MVGRWIWEPPILLFYFFGFSRGWDFLEIWVYILMDVEAFHLFQEVLFPENTRYFLFRTIEGKGGHAESNG